MAQTWTRGAQHTQYVKVTRSLRLTRPGIGSVPAARAVCVVGDKRDAAASRPTSSLRTQHSRPTFEDVRSSELDAVQHTRGKEERSSCARH